MISIVPSSRLQDLPSNALVSNTTSLGSFRRWILIIRLPWMILGIRAFSRSSQSCSASYPLSFPSTTWSRDTGIRSCGAIDTSNLKTRIMLSISTRASSLNQRCWKKMTSKVSTQRKLFWRTHDSSKSSSCCHSVLGHSSISTLILVMLAKLGLHIYGASSSSQSCGLDCSSL